MSHQGNTSNALEALLAASREVPREMLLPGNEPVAASDRLATMALDRAAVALLSRVLTYRVPPGPPIIQLSVCVAGAKAIMVAAPLARACAVLVGRTLQLTADEPRSALFRNAINSDPLPDAFLPGLYHKHIDTRNADLLYGPARAEAMAALARPFRILIADTSGSYATTALAMAPLCTCTILVVEAGVTPLAAIRTMMVSMKTAGGRVVGTVLAAAPREQHAGPAS